VSDLQPPDYPPGYTSPAPPGAGGAPPAPSPYGYPVGTHRLAPYGRRVVAALIDALIIGILASAILVPLGVGLYDRGTDDRGFIGLLVAILLTLVLIAGIGLIYAPLMLWKTNGKTVGRMAAGTRVIRANGERMTFGVAALREIVFKIFLTGVGNSVTVGLPWATLLDVLWPLWDEEKRALHDFPVNTRTVLD
jgi:uncharacterized RDD family membrane protein YckC